MANITKAKHRKSGKEYSIKKMLKLEARSPKKFVKIKSDLVCYECGVPKMVPKLGKVNEHHFAKSPKDNHSFECYYFGDEYTQKEIDSIVKKISYDRPSMDNVQGAFSQIQTYLDRNDSEPADINPNENDISSENGRYLCKDTVKSRSSNSKYIPRKKLDKKISEEDFDVWKIYYGKVGVKFKSENKGFENFVIYKLSEGDSPKYRISLGISPNACKYLSSEQESILDAIKISSKKVHLMVLGKVTRVIVGSKKYYNLTVSDSRLLKLDK